MRPYWMTRTPWCAAAALVTTLTLGWPSAAAGGGRAPGDPQAGASQVPSTVLEELRRVLAEQQKIIEAQAQRLDALERELRQTRSEVISLAKQQSTPLSPALEERLAAIEQRGEIRPEMPADVNAEFPGAFAIPGTSAAIKIGGQVRMTGIHTLDALGTDDRFVTSSIPVGDARPPGDESRVVYTAIPSRFGFDLRTPFVGGRPLRMFIEGDFAAAESSRGFRLRHAFIQTNRFLVGQTWSTFSDPEAEPIGVDFEGLNAISLFRQAQIRYTHQMRPSVALSLAVENPAPDLTGVEGVNQTPDVIARVRWEPSLKGPLPGRVLDRTEHVQAAILARQLRGQVGELSTTVSTGGFGANASGVLAPLWDADDRIKFAANAGRGIGKYITDLGTLGGQDGVYNEETGELEALGVESGYIGYERAWTPTWRSAFTYGIVNVHNLTIQPGDALRRTQRGTFNITWSPVPQSDIGFELLTGTRVNKDGQSAPANQIQLGWSYRF